jgi:hypothetical protein
MKWKMLIALVILVLSFTIFLSNTTICFSDDGGGTSNADSKNPQTAVVEDVVMQQEVPVEFQTSTKCVGGQCIYTVEHHREIEKETHLKSSATCLSPWLKEFWL